MTPELNPDSGTRLPDEEPDDDEDDCEPQDLLRMPQERLPE